jgi:hypothetical protein
VQSLLAAAATIWFAVNASSFLPQGGGVYPNDGAPGGIDGDPGAVAITWAARALFIGLALLSLALVEWDKLVTLLRRMPRDA